MDEFMVYREKRGEKGRKGEQENQIEKGKLTLLCRLGEARLAS
jgi:hypothetical protein